MCIDDFVEFAGSSSGVSDIYDLHVYSAALDGHIDVLLTQNVKDFPSLSTYNVSKTDEFFIKTVLLIHKVIKRSLKSYRCKENTCGEDIKA